MTVQGTLPFSSFLAPWPGEEPLQNLSCVESGFERTGTGEIFGLVALQVSTQCRQSSRSCPSNGQDGVQCGIADRKAEQPSRSAIFRHDLVWETGLQEQSSHPLRSATEVIREESAAVHKVAR